MVLPNLVCEDAFYGGEHRPFEERRRSNCGMRSGRRWKVGRTVAARRYAEKREPISRSQQLNASGTRRSLLTWKRQENGVAVASKVNDSPRPRRKCCRFIVAAPAPSRTSSNSSGRTRSSSRNSTLRPNISYGSPKPMTF